MLGFGQGATVAAELARALPLGGVLALGGGLLPEALAPERPAQTEVRAPRGAREERPGWEQTQIASNATADSAASFCTANLIFGTAS